MDQFQIVFKKPDGTLVPRMVDAELFSLIQGERLAFMSEDSNEEFYDSEDRSDMQGMKKSKKPILDEDMEEEEEYTDSEIRSDMKGMKKAKKPFPPVDEDEEEEYTDSDDPAISLLVEARDLIDSLEQEIAALKAEKADAASVSWKDGIEAYMDALPFLPDDFKLDSIESIADIKKAAISGRMDAAFVEKLDSETAIDVAYELMKSLAPATSRVDGVGILKNGLDHANGRPSNSASIRQQRMDEDYQRSRQPLGKR